MKGFIVGLGLMIAATLNSTASAETKYFEMSEAQLVKMCKRVVSRQGSDVDPNAHKECAGLDEATKAKIEANARDLVALRAENAKSTATANAAHAKAAAAETTANEAKQLATSAKGTAEEAKTEAEGSKIRVGWVEERTTKVEREQRRQGAKMETMRQRHASLIEQTDDNTSRIEGLEAWKEGHDAMRLKLEMKISGVQLAALNGNFGFRGLAADIGLSHGVVTPSLRLYGTVGVTYAGPVDRPLGGRIKLGGTYDLGKNWSVDAGWVSYGLGFGGSGRDPMVIVSGVEPGISKQIGVFTIGGNVMPLGIASSYRAKSGSETGVIVGGSVFIGLSL
jgi:hypothetical protein